MAYQPWTQERVIELLKSGERIRWLPKSIIYNKVIGENTRELFAGKRSLRHYSECTDLYDVLTVMVKAGTLRERDIGNVTQYELVE